MALQPVRESSRTRFGRGCVLARLRRNERGTAVVEFALVAPLLFLLLFGIIGFARALNYYNNLTQLAGQGARAAAVNRAPDGSALSNGNLYSIQQQLATTYVAGSPELARGIVACITQMPAKPGDPVTVRTSFDFNYLPFVGKTLGITVIKLVASSTQRDEVAPVDLNGQPTYATGNQGGNQTGCS